MGFSDRPEGEHSCTRPKVDNLYIACLASLM